MDQIDLICRELKRLLDDYSQCENHEIKEQISIDINLLSTALFLSEQPDE